MRAFVLSFVTLLSFMCTLILAALAAVVLCSWLMKILLLSIRSRFFSSIPMYDDMLPFTLSYQSPTTYLSCLDEDSSPHRSSRLEQGRTTISMKHITLLGFCSTGVANCSILKPTYLLDIDTYLSLLLSSDLCAFYCLLFVRRFGSETSTALRT